MSAALRAKYRALALRGEPGRLTLEAWILASELKACGLTVAGHGCRLVASHGLRTADIDVGARTWTAEARRVDWRTDGTEADIGTVVDVALWLVEQVEPPWTQVEPKGSESFYGAVHPLDRKAS